MKIPDYIERHLQPHLRDTLEPWQLKEVVCLCKQVAADMVSRARQPEKHPAKLGSPSATP